MATQVNPVLAAAWAKASIEAYKNDNPFTRYIRPAPDKGVVVDDYTMTFYVAGTTMPMQTYESLQALEAAKREIDTVTGVDKIAPKPKPSPTTRRRLIFED